MFIRVQVIEHGRYALQSEANRLREVPLAAPRGTIYDRHGRIIAEDVPGYSVSLLALNAAALDDALVRIGRLVVLAPADVEAVRQRYRRAPNRPRSYCATSVSMSCPFSRSGALNSPNS